MKLRASALFGNFFNLKTCSWSLGYMQSIRKFEQEVIHLNFVLVSVSIEKLNQFTSFSTRNAGIYSVVSFLHCLKYRDFMISWYENFVEKLNKVDMFPEIGRVIFFFTYPPTKLNE